MAVKKNDKTLLKKLKKQVKLLQSKERQAENKLKSALKKLRKLGRAYKTKLATKARQMKGKIAETQAATYAKAALHMERQLLKGIDAKSKALESAISKIEKKHAAKLRKTLEKKSKRAGKVKKVNKRPAGIVKGRRSLRKKNKH